MPDFLVRQERFAVVDSTNDVVRGWLADGTLEVCLAVADEQTAGRGRTGRTWVAPPGAALLLSLGFRPDWLEPEHVWRLAATVSLAMAEAAEEAAGLPPRAIRLKWPNDLVVETIGVAVPASPTAATEVRKLAGVLGETEGLGSGEPRAVVGIGIDTDWAANDFPPELATTMTSLRAASSGRRIDHAALLAGFLDRLEARTEALRGGRFDVADWTDRQLTNGRIVEFVTADGATRLVKALGVDVRSGALIVDDPDDPSGERSWLVGEIGHVRVTADPDGALAGLPGLVEV
jgi:BirA family transcriptional regulator, biotin operon repressor / biotin---[acetyl-CoA-carboxylase] ligase